MEYLYTINDIKAEVNVSLQSLYTLIKKNQAFINDNSIRKQRKIYYSQAAMDFFVSYYSPERPAADIKKSEGEEGQEKTEGEEGQENAPEAAKTSLESSSKDFHTESRIAALEAEIDALKVELKKAKEQLDAKEAERLELLRQNGALILTLQQTQQEKMLLLPAPKKSFSDRVKSMFKGKAQEK